MNKRILIIFSMLLVNILSVNASTNVKVVAQDDFSTENPSATADFTVMEDARLGSYQLFTGNSLHCDVIKVTDPKRGKRNATFYVKPVSYITNEGIVNNITETFEGKYTKMVLSKDTLKDVDKVQVAEKAAVTVGNHFVKLFGPAVSMTKGVINSKGDKPIRSGVKQVYKDSPLSYVEKGGEVVIKTGDEFYLVFNTDD